MSQKPFYLLISLVCSLLVAASGLALPSVDKELNVLSTNSGKIRGKVLDSGVRAWLGVPYAKAPVRDLRWQAPQKTSWSGVYNADRYAPQCIQPLRGSNINHYFGHEASSEDCLYMNIWAPEKAPKKEKLPVVVWIHGGGFTLGSPSMANYSGEQLAPKGVIYVSLAYRLGILGFLAHPQLTQESAHHASGNYGLLDQVAALQWIQDNIHKFGGDPERVTIMGQSAGSASVSLLQVSDLTQGLFQRAVGMSGSAFLFNAPAREDAELIGISLQDAFNVHSIGELRHISADRILAKQLDCQLGCRGEIKVGPSIDGYFLTDSADKIFAQGKARDIPVLLGFTKDEGFSPIGSVQTASELSSMLKQMYGDSAHDLLALYPFTNDAEARQAAIEIARDSTLGISMWKWAKFQHKYLKNKAYAYMFSRKHPYTTGITFDDHNAQTVGVYHSADIPYWLTTLDSLNLFRTTRTYTEFDRNLAADMSDVLVAFARSGDPKTDDVNFKAYEPEQNTVINFGNNNTLETTTNWPNSTKFEFFDAHVAMPIKATTADKPKARD